MELQTRVVENIFDWTIKHYLPWKKLWKTSDCEINSLQETSTNTRREIAYSFLLLQSRDKSLKFNCKKEKVEKHLP